MIEASELGTHGNRMVYVFDDATEWERIRLGEARRRGLYVYQCGIDGCERAAHELDHLAPYHQEMNRCVMHEEADKRRDRES
jgi:hypothetical protein